MHLHLRCHTSSITLSSSPPSAHPSINNSRLGGQDLRYTTLTLLLAVPQAPSAGQCWQQDPHASDCNHKPNIYDSHPECDHKHHPNTSPKTNTNPHPNVGASTNVTVNQTWTPAQMQVPQPQSCPWRSHDMGTRNACNDQMHWQCTQWLAINAEMVLGGGHAAWTGWGEDLLKGRGGVSTLLSPSYFYIVGIPSHVIFFL